MASELAQKIYSVTVVHLSWELVCYGGPTVFTHAPNFLSSSVMRLCSIIELSSGVRFTTFTAFICFSDPPPYCLVPFHDDKSNIHCNWTGSLNPLIPTNFTLHWRDLENG